MSSAGSKAVLEQFEQLTVWRRGGERAPHKPLLLLLALAAFQNGAKGVAFSEIERPHTELLREFGPSRASPHPEYPFWRLRNDGVWDVEATRPMRIRASNNDVPRTELRSAHAVGSFSAEVQLALASDSSLVPRIARMLLGAHFPESLHQDLLDAVGLSLDTERLTRRRRDPKFREAVLRAYQHRCALCGLDIRLGSVTIGLEAAHIRWHQADGPDEVSNGIALCSIHHKLFDLGAFTFVVERHIHVSERVHGSEQFDHVLLRHHGQKVAAPVRAEHQPLAVHLGWHRSQVFKAEARPLLSTPADGAA